MVDSEWRDCRGAEAPPLVRASWAGRNRTDRQNRAAAGALLLAGLPYFPFRFDVPEPWMLTLAGAAFLLLAWRICRRS